MLDLIRDYWATDLGLTCIQVMGSLAAVGAYLLWEEIRGRRRKNTGAGGRDGLPERDDPGTAEQQRGTAEQRNSNVEQRNSGTAEQKC